MTSTELPKHYDPAGLENKWYEFWEENGLFEPRGDGEPYCIMLPPPNVTGRLHMGHAFQHTIMDLLSRYHRMLGRKVLWQPGVDHAGIATQMVVERQLAAQGIDKRDIGREHFETRVWEWKEQSGGFITQQMRRLGTSVDWKAQRFTMDEGFRAAVRHAFVELHRDGLIYRGQRLVNWDPALQTALSDLEVENEDEKGFLWHLRYPLVSGRGALIVATTRPETMLGDVAVAVHPDDERYRELVGQHVRLPLTNREIPIIADEYVDPEFGSGCVKITPAHDFNDYDIGQRHELPLISVLHPDATLNDEAPEAYRGMDRFAARKQMVADLDAAGLLEKIEDHQLKVPRGDRSGAVVEPLLTDQWYVRAGPLAERALEVVRNNDLQFVPENWQKIYFQWLENIEDWCISRQLWWGHQIPAWYDADGNCYVGHSEQEVREREGLSAEVRLLQDEDVLDTWFSASLWPFATLGWPEETERLASFYPTSVLVTGFDIIFFWVARMVMMGMQFRAEVPFRETYITGLVRDSQGQKMSKSKGNIIDPIDLVDGISLEDLVEKRTSGLMQPQQAPAIERATRKEYPDGIPAFGADPLRFTFAALATGGRDIRFDTQRIAGYRNFCNKLWNASRYVLLHADTLDLSAARAADPSVVDRWIRIRFEHTVAEARRQIERYRFDLAAKTLYDFAWNEFCDWYIELSKPQLRGAGAQATVLCLVEILEALLRALHPLIPFVSEELWQAVAPFLGKQGASISAEAYPDGKLADENNQPLLDEISWLQEFVLGVRQIRGEYDISPGKHLEILLEGGDDIDRQRFARLRQLLEPLARIDLRQWLETGAQAPESATSLVGKLRILVPLRGLVDIGEELERLGRELEKARAEVERAEKKLANQNFVARAPDEVVEKERAKLAVARQRAEDLEAQRVRLSAVT